MESKPYTPSSAEDAEWKALERLEQDALTTIHTDLVHQLRSLNDVIVHTANLDLDSRQSTIRIQTPEFPHCVDLVLFPDPQNTAEKTTIFMQLGDRISRSTSLQMRPDEQTGLAGNSKLWANVRKKLTTLIH